MKRRRNVGNRVYDKNNKIYTWWSRLEHIRELLAELGLGGCLGCNVGKTLASLDGCNLLLNGRHDLLGKLEALVFGSLELALERADLADKRLLHNIKLGSRCESADLSNVTNNDVSSP